MTTRISRPFPYQTSLLYSYLQIRWTLYFCSSTKSAVRSRFASCIASALAFLLGDAHIQLLGTDYRVSWGLSPHHLLTVFNLSNSSATLLAFLFLINFPMLVNLLSFLTTCLHSSHGLALRHFYTSSFLPLLSKPFMQFTGNYILSSLALVNSETTLLRLYVFFPMTYAPLRVEYPTVFDHALQAIYDSSPSSSCRFSREALIYRIFLFHFVLYLSYLLRCER